jgi:tetratricopeptide (TPR) repeat protein
MASGGPDALYGLRRALPAAEAPASAADLLSLMRRCGPDPRVVAECLRPLWPHLAEADDTLRRDVRDAVIAAWPNYYHLGDSHDLAFSLGLLLYEVRAYAEARTLFEESLRLYGDDAATLWNRGLCEVALGRPDAATTSSHRARRLAPDLFPAGLAVVKAGATGGA